MPSPPLGVSGSSVRGAFDVDPRARLAVVVVGTSGASAGDGALFWVDLAAEPPRVVEQVRVDARPDEVRISGARAVVSIQSELLWFERGKGQVARQRPTAQPIIEHLLGFDGRTAYYSILDFTDHLVTGIGTASFGDTGPAPPLLVTDDAAETMVETDGGLAVGFPNELLLVHPRCE